jgi:UDP-glucose 4-epimerase
MSNILITGGAGFIGTNLIKRLVKDKHTIISIDDYSSGKLENHIEGVKYYKCHTRDIKEKFSISFDVCFHLGEYSRIATSFDDIERVWHSNSNGTFEIVNFCKKNNIKIIYGASSTKFADEGVNHSPYSFTKSKSVDLIKNYSKWYDLKYSICYFYNVFGPGYDTAPIRGYESVVSIFEQQYKSNTPLTICGNGHQRRTFTYVNDIVEGLISSWKYKENEEFQLNNYKEYSILEIAKMFTDNITYIEDRPGDRKNSITTDNKSRELLDWETTMGIDEWVKKIKML